MYFMQSGECRVVMEVCKESKNIPTALPQAALNSYESSNLLPKMKSSHSHLMALHGLASTCITNTFPKQGMVTDHPLSSTSRTFLRSDNVSCSVIPSSQISDCRSSCILRHDMSEHQRKEVYSLSRMSFASMATGTDSECTMKYPRQAADTIKHLNPYTLTSFLRDLEGRDFGVDLIPDLDFSDKHALSWNTGTNLGGMLRGDVSDGTTYQCKFENWARKVLSIERKRHYAEAHDSVSSISTESIRNTWPTRSKKPVISEDTVFLDVGALHPGDFFGEIGLLHHSQRKASILTVTEVEVLVLNKWDLNRQVDKDIVDCLSANDYKNIEDAFQQYQRTCRWARYKKKLMEEVLAARRRRFPNLSERHMCKNVPSTKFQRRD